MGSWEQPVGALCGLSRWASGEDSNITGVILCNKLCEWHNGRYEQWNSFLIITFNSDYSVVSIKNCFPKPTSCDYWHVCFFLFIVSGEIHLERERLGENPFIAACWSPATFWKPWARWLCPAENVSDERDESFAILTWQFTFSIFNFSTCKEGWGCLSAS